MNWGALGTTLKSAFRAIKLNLAETAQTDRENGY
jgi:hypothetical protein